MTIQRGVELYGGHCRCIVECIVVQAHFELNTGCMKMDCSGLKRECPEKTVPRPLPLSFVSKHKADNIEDVWAYIMDDICASSLFVSFTLWRETADRQAGKAHPTGLISFHATTTNNNNNNNNKSPNNYNKEIKKKKALGTPGLTYNQHNGLANYNPNLNINITCTVARY